MKRTILFLAFIVVFCLSTTYAATYYVSTSGNDSNSGSISSPWRTINASVAKLGAGDILYVRGGTYAERVGIYVSGTSSSKITVSAYSSEIPIIDGSTLSMGIWDVMVEFGGSYVNMSGIEVKNSKGRGIAVSNSAHHTTISNVNVHHCWMEAICIYANYTIVEDSRVWQNTLVNSATPGTPGSGLDTWPGAFVTGQYGTNLTIPCTGSIYRRNVVYNNWGEGMMIMSTQGVTLEDNVVYNNWSVNIYVESSQDALVQRNLCYATPDTPITGYKNVPFCFLLADESYSPQSKNLKIINNLTYGSISLWWNATWNSTADRMENVLFANNTFMGGFELGATIAPAAHTNVRVKNNILPTGTYTTSGNGITYSNNVVGDPGLLKTGSFSNTAWSIDYFKLTAGATAAINTGANLTTTESFTTDFAKVTRPASGAWEIGAFEYGTSSPSSNLALGKAVTVSSTQVGGYEASMAVDGNATTRWSSTFSDPQWIYVDLGATYNISRVLLNWEGAYGSAYKVQVSNDASSWTDIYSTTTGNGGIDDLTWLSGSGRYVRMYGTTRGTEYGYSLFEFEVYGTLTGGSTNIALTKPVTVSSTQTGGYEASKAVDGNGTTRWSSTFSDPQWIYVDLGATYTISRVLLNWEGAYGSAYKVQVSNDASSWSDIYSTTTGNGGIDDLTGLSGSGRYVRMYGTTRATEYGYSLFEFEVYGNPFSNNLLLNPGFESGTTSWYGAACTITSSTNAHGGTKSVVTSSRTASYAGPRQDIKNILNANGQGSYLMEGWIKTTSGTANGRVLIEIVANGETLYFGTAVAVNSTSYTKVSIEINLTWTGSITSAVFYLDTQTGTTNFYADDCVLQRNGGLKKASVYNEITTVDVPKISIYPNPANSSINLEFSSLQKEEKVKIYNATGRIVKELIVTGLSKQINVEDLNSGMYFIKMNSYPQLTHKFIKK